MWGGVEGGLPLPQFPGDGHLAVVKRFVPLWGCGEASPHRSQCAQCGGTGAVPPRLFTCCLLLSPLPFPVPYLSKASTCRGVCWCERGHAHACSYASFTAARRKLRVHFFFGG